MDCDIIDCDIISNYPTELHESIKPERDNHIHGTYLILRPKFCDHFNQFFPNSNPHMMPNRVLKFNEVALQYPYSRCIRGLINILDGEWQILAVALCQPAICHQQCEWWDILIYIIKYARRKKFMKDSQRLFADWSHQASQFLPQCCHWDTSYLEYWGPSVLDIGIGGCGGTIHVWQNKMTML